MRSFIT